MTLTDAPAAKSLHTAAWIGTEMLLWGGQGNGYSAALHSFHPPRPIYLYLRQ